MKYILIFSFLVYGIIACSNKKQEPEEEELETKTTNYFKADDFVMGVDLSYVNQIEDHGGVYKDSGKVRDPFKIMKDHGANMVRVRLWHNPVWVRTVYGNNQKTLYSGYADVLKTIQRAKALGLAVNLDIHYSDTWADPGKQIPPAAWANITNIQVLKDSIYNYTYKILDNLNSKGLMPEMVQIGNETNCGMMMTGLKTGFPNLDGCKENWQNLGIVFNSGIKAVRDVALKSNIKPKIALHIADPKNVEWWFGKITSSASVSDFDVIGISYYPLWHTTISFDNIPALILKLKDTYKKKVMIMETAYPWTNEFADNYNNQFGSQASLSGFPFTKDGQFRFMTSLTQYVIKAGGDGVMYWEPAWITSQLKDSWGTGSSWENCTFFDFSGNTISSIDWMRHIYKMPK